MKSENQRIFLSFIDLITYLHVLSNDHVYFTLENMAKTCFENLKKRYNKKQNAVKRATDQEQVETMYQDMKMK